MPPVGVAARVAEAQHGCPSALHGCWRCGRTDPPAPPAGTPVAGIEGDPGGLVAVVVVLMVWWWLRQGFCGADFPLGAYHATHRFQ